MICVILCWISFLSHFIIDIPNELIKCIGMQIVGMHNLNLHNDEESKWENRFLLFWPLSMVITARWSIVILLADIRLTSFVIMMMIWHNPSSLSLFSKVNRSYKNEQNSSTLRPPYERCCVCVYIYMM